MFLSKKLISLAIIALLAGLFCQWRVDWHAGWRLAGDREFSQAMILMAKDSTAGTDLEGHATNLICGHLVSERLWQQREMAAFGGAALLLAGAWLAWPKKSAPPACGAE